MRCDTTMHEKIFSLGPNTFLLCKNMVDKTQINPLWGFTGHKSHNKCLLWIDNESVEANTQSTKFRSAKHSTNILLSLPPKRFPIFEGEMRRTVMPKIAGTSRGVLSQTNGNEAQSESPEAQIRHVLGGFWNAIGIRLDITKIIDIVYSFLIECQKSTLKHGSNFASAVVGIHFETSEKRVQILKILRYSYAFLVWIHHKTRAVASDLKTCDGR